MPGGGGFPGRGGGGGEPPNTTELYEVNIAMQLLAILACFNSILESSRTNHCKFFVDIIFSRSWVWIRKLTRRQ